ncbi:uncharacterized protein LOC123506150 [Portunus trituberculatus]|uniref:uncharacterized protein LOC123506150 n=1 Tax=Portunus trituberculatus TaxID=210409 RepID=UPI001E1CB25C|nr:uncharacterized protein LOC123506150 [Portunus trituberculatus]
MRVYIKTNTSRKKQQKPLCIDRHTIHNTRAADATDGQTCRVPHSLPHSLPAPLWVTITSVGGRSGINSIFSTNIWKGTSRYPANSYTSFLISSAENFDEFSREASSCWSRVPPCVPPLCLLKHCVRAGWHGRGGSLRHEVCDWSGDRNELVKLSLGAGADGMLGLTS